MSSILVPVLLLILCATVLAVGMVVAGQVLGPKRTTDVKRMPYESGMDPIHDARRRFDFRFHAVRAKKSALRRWGRNLRRADEQSCTFTRTAFVSRDGAPCKQPSGILLTRFFSTPRRCQYSDRDGHPAAAPVSYDHDDCQRRGNPAATDPHPQCQSTRP